jgi:hypothetical protein
MPLPKEEGAAQQQEEDAEQLQQQHQQEQLQAEELEQLSQMQPTLVVGQDNGTIGAAAAAAGFLPMV